MNTAAHYAVFGGKFRNFEILMQHETNIWKPNFRGIRPYDVFSRKQQIGSDYQEIKFFNVVSVRDRLKKYYMNNILFGCKIQSLVNKNLAGERGQLVDLIEKSSYQLGEDLRKMKFGVEKEYKTFFENAKNELIAITKYLNKAELDFLGIKPDQKSSLFDLFTKEQLDKEPFFKYTNGEKWEKRELLNLIDYEIDFSQPLSSSIKKSYNMRQLFCIEVTTNSRNWHNSVLYQ